jgi:hypothetical protein
MDNELEQQLDAFARGESDPPAFIEKLCADCNATPDLAWDVLAITDQYRRRGRISAELSRTIRIAIERPAVAREVPDLADTMATVPTARIPQPPPIRWTSPPAAIVPPAHCNHQDELRALRAELEASRRTVLRYRTRVGKLGAFGRRQRNAVAMLRRELELSRIPTLVPSPAPLAVGLYDALDLAPPYEPVAASVVAQSVVVEKLPYRKRWISVSQAAAAMALLLTVTSSPALRDASIRAVTVPAAGSAATAVSARSVSAPAPVAAAARGPQYLSIGRDQYIVAPAERQAMLRVQRIGGSSGDVSFMWWTRPSGAKSGIDYRGRPPIVARLPDGVDAMTISVPIFSNPLRAHTELFYVEIGHPSKGAAIGAIGRSAIILVPAR